MKSITKDQIVTYLAGIEVRFAELAIKINKQRAQSSVDIDGLYYDLQNVVEIAALGREMIYEYFLNIDMEEEPDPEFYDEDMEMEDEDLIPPPLPVSDIQQEDSSQDSNTESEEENK